MWNYLRCTAFVAVFLSTAPSAFAATVVFDVTSSSHGATVPVGANIQWSITVSASSGDNLGLSLVSVDLVQAPTNPSLFDLSPASSIPAGMEGFSRPLGICNPGPGGVGTGYGGTLLGPMGGRNLVQIGGAQNTFGVANSSLGEDVDVNAGVGQSPGGQIIAEGSFFAPATPGSYTIGISNLHANTLVSISPAPNHSSCAAAVTSVGQESIQFNVCLLADTNLDGEVSVSDVPNFVNALLDPGSGSSSMRCAADTNGDGAIDGEDVQGFVDALLI